MEGWRPYAQQFVIEGEGGPEGVLYAATTAGLNLPDVVREHVEEMAREHFRRQNPGVEIVSGKWMTLYDVGGDDE